MARHSSEPVRSATSAGIAFAITDLEVAGSLMRAALTGEDSMLAVRSYNHAVRTLDEINELLTRATPTAQQQSRLTSGIASLQAQLTAFRALPR